MPAVLGSSLRSRAQLHAELSWIRSLDTSRVMKFFDARHPIRVGARLHIEELNIFSFFESRGRGKAMRGKARQGKVRQGSVYIYIK